MGEINVTGIFCFLFGIPAIVVLLIAARRAGPAETITRKRMDRWE